MSEIKFKRKNIRLNYKMDEWIKTKSEEIGVTQNAFIAMKLNESMNQDGFLSTFEKLQRMNKDDIKKLAKSVKENEGIASYKIDVNSIP